MKAAVVDAVGAGFKIAEVELARPVGREVLIDVRASGLCHTDLTIATQDVGVFPMPVLCGHEVAGVVAEVGGAPPPVPASLGGRFLFTAPGIAL